MRLPYFAAATGAAPLTADATLLMSATSCASKVTLRPFAPAAVPASSIALITTPSTANPTRSMLAACGLTRAVTASMFGA